MLLAELVETSRKVAAYAIPLGEVAHLAMSTRRPSIPFAERHATAGRSPSFNRSPGVGIPGRASDGSKTVPGAASR
jgi:hypothetical protein